MAAETSTGDLCDCIVLIWRINNIMEVSIVLTKLLYEVKVALINQPYLPILLKPEVIIKTMSIFG